MAAFEPTTYGPPVERKMLPYDFWKSIGSPRTVVAPMVDNSELAFRMQTRKYGAELVYTQMFNSNIFSQSKECRNQLFTTCPEDHPLIVQIAGHDPETMLAAARYVEDHCDAVDINLGCPQGIAKRGRYGAFLMEELELLDKIVRTLVTGLKVPVTCKTRVYKDFATSIRLCEVLVNAGASMLTIHGRTRDEKGHTIGEANWDMIARIKEHFSKKEIPVPIVANGGIENMDDLERCLTYTKADAVMTSEAILENPALFSRNLTLDTGIYRSHFDLADEYLDLVDQYPLWHIKCVRSHMMKMLYRYIAEDDELRNILANCNKLPDFRKAAAQIRAAYSQDQIIEMSKNREISWYNRHRFGKGGVVGDDEGGCSGKMVETKKKLIEMASCVSDGSIFDAFDIFSCGETKDNEE